MGKWTLEYHDEVLRNKVKNLVQGAIKRMNAEKDGSLITYEAFVEELDEGDSFTTSLVDVLVKELAERRMRPNPGDRRLISIRTAKILRMQTSPVHIYHSGGSIRDRTRRSINPIPPPRPYGTSLGMLSDSDGEEEYGTMLDSIGRLEGTQINTDLYDAYRSSTYDLPGTLTRPTDRTVHSPDPPEHPVSWRMNSPSRSPPPVSAHPTWTGLGGTGSALTRQSTIRRPHRSRTMDSNQFTSFTSRRRSVIRNNTTEQDIPRAESHSEASGRPSSSNDNTRSGDSTNIRYMDIITGRPIDFTAWMTSRRSGSSSLATGADEPPSGTSTTHNPSSSQMWYSMTTSTSPPPEPMSITALSRRSSTTDLNDDRRQVIAPRLRRGGLRPPESLLLGPGNSPSELSSVTDVPSPVALADVIDPEDISTSQFDIPSVSIVPARGSSAQIPTSTPRSRSTPVYPW